AGCILEVCEFACQRYTKSHTFSLHDASLPFVARDLNPFRFSGPLPPEQMIDRDPDADGLLALADGGHSFRLVGPRRYGKTTLLRRVLAAAEREGTATVLVDLQDVLSIAEIVVRIERGYERLKGPVRRHVENLFRTWNIGLSLVG